MDWRRIAIVLALGLLASCGSGTGSDDDGASYRTTLGYFLESGDTTVSGVSMKIISDGDISLVEQQTGANQTASTGFIVGQIVDSLGDGVPGVTLHARNDLGLSAGALFYQSAISGTFVSSAVLNVTSTTGWFVVMNVQPGRVNLKCFDGADGNLFVHVVAGGAIYTEMEVTASGTQPTWTGVTQNLGGPGTALPSGAEEEADYSVLSFQSLTGTSAPTTGAINFGTVPARNSFVVRCTKTGFVPTYTYVTTATNNLTTANGGNVFIASVANRDAELVPSTLTLTPGTGILRGVVMSNGGGFTVQARDSNDQIVGDVVYGDAGTGSPDDALTDTEPDGIFYIYNVPPGLALLRATKSGEAASAYVYSIADSITMTPALSPAPQLQPTVMISGALVTLLGSAVAGGTIRLHGLGIGDESDQFGEYTMTNVPTRHAFIVRTSK